MTAPGRLAAAQRYWLWCFDCGARWTECQAAGQQRKCCPDCRHPVVDDPAPDPTADLPAVLSSVEDVARVCSGDGWKLTWSLPPDDLTREWEHESGVQVRAEQGVTIMGVTVRPTTHGYPRWQCYGPDVHLDVLWRAIQAARGGEPDV